METLSSCMLTNQALIRPSHCPVKFSSGGSVSVLGFSLSSMKAPAFPNSCRKQNFGVVRASVAVEQPIEKTKVAALIRIGTRGSRGLIIVEGRTQKTGVPPRPNFRFTRDRGRTAFQ